MFTYQKFLVKDTDRFDPFQFPGLETSLQQVIAALATEAFEAKAEMLISFVRDHSIKTDWATGQPKLTTMVTSKTLPLSDMENLFESSRNNVSFQKGLETYIRDCFTSAPASFQFASNLYPPKIVTHDDNK